MSKLTHYGWGIVNKDGKPQFVFAARVHKNIADARVKTWNGIPKLIDRPYRVVELFYKEDGKLRSAD